MDLQVCTHMSTTQPQAEAVEAEESGDLDGDDIIQIIPGSEKLVPGGIPVEGGVSRIHSLQAKYNPYALRAVSLLFIEDETSADEIVIQKLLKQAGVIMSSIDNLEELWIPTMEKFSVTWSIHQIAELPSGFTCCAELWMDGRIQGDRWIA